jgi:hypothetical protein
MVGSQKVPSEFFSKDVSDFNVAVGNQPHSECASLAVFLDRFFGGKELAKTFENAKFAIVPQERGKKIVRKVYSESETENRFKLKPTNILGGRKSTSDALPIFGIKPTASVPSLHNGILEKPQLFYSHNIVLTFRVS